MAYLYKINILNYNGTIEKSDCLLNLDQVALITKEGKGLYKIYMTTPDSGSIYVDETTYNRLIKGWSIR